MKIGIPKETREGESRVAMTPDTVKRLVKKRIQVLVESSAGMTAGFSDEDYVREGAEVVDTATALSADVVFKVNRPALPEVSLMKRGAMLLSILEPYTKDGLLEKMAEGGVDSIALELIPRISRAQSMDVLSSQANIAGYRAVLEAANHYQRFFPMMMTSAGSAKAAKVFILGVGVAGLQAIATAKRLGATVEAYDVRPVTKEQVQSLGAKFFEVDINEGVGQGGYAKELSEEGKKKLQAALAERLMKSDIIISTANVPGRRAPILVQEEVVRGMRRGSVIVDMAAPSGGNCALTEPGRIVNKHGVTIVGVMNLPGQLAADASSFYSRNLFTLLSLMLDEKGADKDSAPTLNVNLQDEIIAASLTTHQGRVVWKGVG